ncbi:transcription elongation factor GreA [bacterium]|nr:transcription elongation factor GreA [bacterium]
MRKIYLTTGGLEKMRQDLDRLVNKVRPIAVADLAQAREKGDLSENAEYDAAREKLSDIDRQINELHQKFNNVQLISTNDLDKDEIRILSTVTIKDLGNNFEMKYTIVDPVQADPAKKLISFKSPIAKGLMGKKVGDVAEIQVPSGVKSYEIISTEFCRDL